MGSCTSFLNARYETDWCSKPQAGVLRSICFFGLHRKSTREPKSKQRMGPKGPSPDRPFIPTQRSYHPCPIQEFGAARFVRGRSLRPSGLEPNCLERGRSLRPWGLEPNCLERGRSLRPWGLEPNCLERGRSLRPWGLEPAWGAAVAALADSSHQKTDSLRPEQGKKPIKPLIFPNNRKLPKRPPRTRLSGASAPLKTPKKPPKTPKFNKFPCFRTFRPLGTPVLPRSSRLEIPYGLAVLGFLL